MTGEEPVVAVEILGGVLEFTIDGFVGLFEDGGAGGASALAVSFDIVDKKGKALRAVAQFAGRACPGGKAFEHDPGIRGAQLRSADGIPVAVVFGEGEGAMQPGDGLLEVAIADVGDQGIGGYGAIVDHAQVACAAKKPGALSLFTIENEAGACLVKKGHGCAGAIGMWLPRRAEAGLYSVGAMPARARNSCTRWD